MGSHIHRLLLNALSPWPSTPPPEAKVTGVGVGVACLLSPCTRTETFNPEPTQQSRTGT